MLGGRESKFVGDCRDRGIAFQLLLGLVDSARQDERMRRKTCKALEPLQKRGWRQCGQARQLVDRIIFPGVFPDFIHKA